MPGDNGHRHGYPRHQRSGDAGLRLADQRWRRNCSGGRHDRGLAAPGGYAGAWQTWSKQHGRLRSAGHRTACTTRFMPKRLAVLPWPSEAHPQHPDRCCRAWRNRTRPFLHSGVRQGHGPFGTHHRIREPARRRGCSIQDRVPNESLRQLEGVPAGINHRRMLATHYDARLGAAGWPIAARDEADSPAPLSGAHAKQAEAAARSPARSN